MNESNKIRVGVIGAGKMSQKTHLPIISRLQNDGVYTLVVICDLNVDAARQAAEKFGFENYIHEADSVFNYDIDALYVFATAQLHYEYSYKALQRGVHVFIEKPPAPSVEDFQKLIDASNRTGCVGVVGLNRRFQKNIELIKEELSGTGLYAMEAVFHKPVAEEQPPHGAKTWLPINAIHSLDLLVYLKGAMPYRIHTATNAVNTDVPQNFSVLLEWKDGTHAVLSSDYSAGGRVERYAFHGYNTSFEVDLSDKPTYTKSKGGRVQRVAEEHTVAFRGFDGEHEAFARAINTGEAARHAFKDCIAAVYLTDLIERGFSGDIPTLQVESNQPLVNNESMKINNKASLLILNADNVKQHLPTLKKEFKVVFYDDLSQCDSEQKKAITALITGPGGVPITAEMIDDLPNLEIAGIVAASLKSYNTEVLLDKGVQIFNASDAYADSVAEFVLMQAIAGVREATRSHDIMRAGGWGLAHTPRRSLMAQTKKTP
jgi:predicted dehydrogenase